MIILTLHLLLCKLQNYSPLLELQMEALNAVTLVNTFYRLALLLYRFNIKKIILTSADLQLVFSISIIPFQLSSCLYGINLDLQYFSMH